MQAAKKPPASAAPGAAKKAAPPSKAPAKPAAASAGSLEAFKYKHTPEDADALAAELIPANIINDLGDGAWKVRLAAVEELTTWLDGVVDTVDAEVVVRMIAKKCWNDKNFQVRHGVVLFEVESHVFEGVKQAVWCAEHAVKELPKLRKVLHCFECWPSVGEVGRLEVEKAGRRHTLGLRRKDVFAVRSVTR